MTGWVIVYLPGGDVYSMLDMTLPPKASLAKRVARTGLKTLLAAVQVWFWVRK